MPYFCLILLLQLSALLYAQEQGRSAEESVQHLVLAASAREEQVTQQLSEVRAKIRQQFPSEALLLEFDNFFSALVKKDRTIYALPSELQVFINPILPLDSLAILVENWQKIRLQNLRLIQQDLRKERVAAPEFADTSVLFQYLTFFDIQSGEKVAELGAGSGWLSLLLNVLYEDIELYINELGVYSIRQLQRNLLPELTKAQAKSCHFVTGTQTSTGLEMNQLDLIIAVDAFHHFSDKASMLKSIKWALAKNGRFCLVEQVKTLGSADSYCPQALEKWELETLLQQNGFIKSREQLLISHKSRNIYLLEYVVNPL